MTEVIVIDEGDALSHVQLKGRLDIAGVSDVEVRFTASTAARGKNTLVDLSQLAFIASLGIGMLVKVYRTLESKGARMVLIAPPELVHETLRAASIHRIIPIAADRDEAVSLLSAG